MEHIYPYTTIEENTVRGMTVFQDSFRLRYRLALRPLRQARQVRSVYLQRRVCQSHRKVIINTSVFSISPVR